MVSTRHDPPLALARLRARGQLAELRLSKLRFTLGEAAAFLNDRLRLDLSREELASLHAGTEGWAAGLRLLASSLNQIPTSTGRAAFVNHLIRNNSAGPRASGVLAATLRAPLPLLPGGTERLEHYCRRALARFGDGVGPVQAGAHSLLGYISFLRGRLDRAVQRAERARAISRQLGGFTHLEGEVDLVLAGACSARGDHAAVERYWEARLPWIEQTPAVSFWTVTILYYIGRAQWMQGHMDRAWETYARIAAIAQPRELPEAMVSGAAMRALMAIGDGRFEDAEGALREGVAIEQRMPHCLAFCSARVLLAHLYLVQGRRQAAATALAPVLAECERGDMPGLILREGDFVLQRRPRTLVRCASTPQAAD